jgi:hypothetical protein
MFRKVIIIPRQTTSKPAQRLVTRRAADVDAVDAARSIEMDVAVADTAAPRSDSELHEATQCGHGSIVRCVKQPNVRAGRAAQLEGEPASANPGRWTLVRLRTSTTTIRTASQRGQRTTVPGARE